MLSIIIVNYKVKNQLIECISSIYRYPLNQNYEIIVVDNDEEKNIGKDLKKKFPKVKYIESYGNSGYGGGCNLGAKYSKGNILFFLNPDTKVFDRTLNNLYDFINKNKKVGIISPLLVHSDMKPFSLQGTRKLTPLKAIFSLSFINKYFPNNPISKNYWLRDWDKKNAKEVDVIPGTAFMISRNLFMEVGGFDEFFFLYFEEFDFCNRIKELGYKIYIDPRAKLYHEWGASTNKIKNLKKIFSQSKFYYFRKWYGLFVAIIVNLLISINKNQILIFLILLLGTFLRFYKLKEYMTLIGDQGWFYLSARNMLITGKIPLVGITSSHTWLHQGPLWTYIIAIIFWIFNFNPIAPAYFTAALGIFTIYLFYKLIGEIFSKNTGLFAAALYATSPLIVINDRFPYHTTLIPFFTIIFIYAFYKWLNGKIIFFPLIIFTLSILYNLELFTAVLWIIFILFIVWSLIKKETFVIKINKKIILLSCVSFITPMLPILIYDASHGFNQTLIFTGWIFYKGVLFVGKNHIGNILPLIYYLWINYQKLLYPLSAQISLFLLLGSIGLFVFSLKRKFYFNYFIIISVFALLTAVFINKSLSDAYLPAFFPFVILIASVFFERLTNMKSINYIVLFFFLIIISFNSMYLVATIFFSNKNYSFAKRMEAVDKIVNMVKDQKYNISGIGEGSQFKSFTMNYEYLLWWEKHPASNNPQKIKIIISEDNNGIHVGSKGE